MNVRDMIAGRKSMPMKCGMDFLSYRIGKARAGGGGEIASFWGYIDSNPSYFSELKQTADWGAMTDAEKTYAYNNYVNSLPCSGLEFRSTGYGLRWTPNVSFKFSTTNGLQFNGTLVNPLSGTFNYSSACSPNILLVQDLKAPVTGVYSDCSSRYPLYVPTGSCTGSRYCSISTNCWYVSNNSKSFSEGATVVPNTFCLVAQGNPAGTNYSTTFTLSFFINPNSSDVITNNYPSTSRPASIVNNCIISNIVTNEDNSTTTNNYKLTVPIIDESTLAFTNPATSTTTTMSSWWYDYSTRTYHLADASSNEHTVCYGDDKLTIVSGGTTTEYSYMI